MLRIFSHLSGVFACMVIVLSAVQPPIACGQAFTLLHTFGGTDGCDPRGDLTLGGSTLYGMTLRAGSPEYGNIFSINTNGTGFQNLYSFNDNSVVTPHGSLTLSGSTLYGMAQSGLVTNGGNTWGPGGIFSINTDGTGYKNLLLFNGTNGSNPEGSLTLSGSTLYGMTRMGGSSNYGNIFSINTDGTGFHNLFSFSAANVGKYAYPWGNLTLSGSTLYGMISGGGISDGYGGYGTIFSINTDGTGFKSLFSFHGTNGLHPKGSLTLSGSTLYGSAENTIFSINTDGTGYRVLYSSSNIDFHSIYPLGTLTLSGSTLYGMSQGGGSIGYGTIFSINTDGTGFQNLYSLDYQPDGGLPFGGLILSSKTLYGMTSDGGTLYGTVFALTVPEPSTFILLGIGALSLLTYGWRRKRQAA